MPELMEFDTDTLVWIGIVFCISQSAMFSGLNLAFFSLSRLQLEVEMKQGNRIAGKVLAVRQDSNFLLTTILWGNVGINVLLTLLSDSVMAGVAAFAFSTVFITVFGEILPQAYFSRNALRMASPLASTTSRSISPRAFTTSCVPFHRVSPYSRCRSRKDWMSFTSGSFCANS